MPRPSLHALTGLRFVAAMHVVLFHTAAAAFAEAPRWVHNVLGSGYTGVSLFFVLSGFVLAYNYLDPVAERPLDRAGFWRARFARVYPVYVLSLVVALPLFLKWAEAGGTSGDRLLAAGVPTVALAQAWLPSIANKWNNPAWSLSVEAFFYALFPFAAPAFVGMSARRLLVSAAALWAISLGAPLWFLDSVAPGAPGAEFWLAVLKFNPLVRLPEFLIGIALGQLYLAHGPRMHRGAGTWLGIAAAVVVVGALVIGRIPYPLLHNSALTPAYAALVLALALGGGPLARLLATRPMVRLGEASYALYLLHVPVVALLTMYTPLSGVAGQQPALFLGLYLALVTGISLAVLQWWEEPLRRRLRGRTPSVAEPAGVAAPAGALPPPPVPSREANRI